MLISEDWITEGPLYIQEPEWQSMLIPSEQVKTSQHMQKLELHEAHVPRANINVTIHVAE